MEQIKMKTWVFIPTLIYRAKNCLSNSILCISLLALSGFLSGCKTTKNTASLAPIPPSMNKSSYVHSFVENTPAIYPEIDMISSGSLVVDKTQAVPVSSGIISSLRGCRTKDRFDRKALLAYEWGRARMSLDVDGVNLSGGGEKAVMFEYKLKFSSEKTKAQRCRYNSKWQGLIGSGYNELVIRENDTVWIEVKKLKAEIYSHVSSVF